MGNTQYYVRVSGTPGMGKTTFLSYAYKCLKDEFSVIARVKRNICLFSSGQILSDTQTDELIAHSNAFDHVFLLDASKSMRPAVSNVVFVVFASPDRKNLGGLSSNYMVADILMPTWEEQELKDCLGGIYTQKFDMSKFDERFKRWGGSIASMLNFERMEFRFREFLADSSFPKMIMLMGSMGNIVTEIPKRHQWVLHQSPAMDTNGHPIYNTVLAPFVCRLPSNMLTTEAVSRYIYLKPDPTKLPPGTFLGIAYERYVMSKLSQDSSVLGHRLNN